MNEGKRREPARVAEISSKNKSVRTSEGEEANCCFLLFIDYEERKKKKKKTIANATPITINSSSRNNKNKNEQFS